VEPGDHKRKRNFGRNPGKQKQMWEDHMCTKSKQKLWEEPRLTKTNVGGTHVNNRKQNYGWNPVNAQIN